MNIEKRITSINYTKGSGIGRIKYIVIHYFGSLGTASSVANYFQSANRQASAHYILDEGSTVYQCVEDKDIAWHCGTSNGYKHPDCRNANSIGIEVRPLKLDHSTVSSASVRDWYFSDQIIKNLVEFTKQLMDKYNIPPENVIRHYDVTGKWCPRPYMGDDINEYYGVSGNQMWDKFKTMISAKEEDNMDQATFDQMFATAMVNFRNGLRDNNCSKYSEQARKWAIESGLFNGGGIGADGLPNMMWEDFLTREQAAVLFYRFFTQHGG